MEGNDLNAGAKIGPIRQLAVWGDYLQNNGITQIKQKQFCV